MLKVFMHIHQQYINKTEVTCWCVLIHTLQQTDHYIILNTFLFI